MRNPITPTPERPCLLVDKHDMREHGALAAVLYAVLHETHSTSYDMEGSGRLKWFALKKEKVLDIMGISKKDFDKTWDDMVRNGIVLPKEEHGIVYFQI